MNTINHLKQDHDLFRSKLNVLESALGGSTEIGVLVEDVSRTLLQQLQPHIAREEALLASCHFYISAKQAEGALRDHRSARQNLDAVRQFFAEQPNCVLERMRPLFVAVVAGLRRGIDQQETTLFPAVEGALVLQGLARRQAPLIRVEVNSPGREPDRLDEPAWGYGTKREELRVLFEQIGAWISHTQIEGGGVQWA